MPVDKNLFLYDLAVVAIFKNEGRYLQEWLDYHLLAGVEHFYLYNNDSTDDYKEILAPYVEAGLVTLIDWPGKFMQMLAYDDALRNYKFLCRYMAFIDLDEFIFPKTNQSIVEVIDEVFSRDEHAAALGINQQIFGSNGQETADFSRGVLERFTRRAPSDWVIFNETEPNKGNIYIKSVVNPRLTDYFQGPHFAIFFVGFKEVNAHGKDTFHAGSYPVSADKIVYNHYYIKSREEFSGRVNLGSAARTVNYKKTEWFDFYDRNEVFDDGILKYRTARAENFSLESDAAKIRRVEKTLVDTLTERSPLDAPADFFTGKLETFLTCRAVAELLGTKIGSRSAEEFALVWLYQTLTRATTITYAEVQLFIKALPKILSRPFPLTKKILQLTCDGLIPTFCEALKKNWQWHMRTELLDLQNFLRLIK